MNKGKFDVWSDEVWAVSSMVNNSQMDGNASVHIDATTSTDSTRTSSTRTKVIDRACTAANFDSETEWVLDSLKHAEKP